MSNYLKFAMPHVITEFDNDMLVPLEKNFSAIQRALVLIQVRVDTLETNYTALEARVAAIEAYFSTST